MFPDYPFHADILTSLQNASVRPKTPAYQSISIVISHKVSPPAGIDPPVTEQTMASEINDALQSKLVIP
jgi:multiple sugar transport system substrate-binding protein